MNTSRRGRLGTDPGREQRGGIAGEGSRDAGARAAWSIVEHRGRQALEVLEADWRRLYASMPLRTAFQSYELQNAYADYIMAAPDRLRCLVLSDGERARAICPLEARTDDALGYPIRVWGVPHHPHVPLSDVIGPEDDARRAFLPALVDFLRRSPEGRQLLVVGPLPESSILWQGLSDLLSGDYCVRSAWEPFVFDCRQSFDELAGGLSVKFRKNLRRYGRRLSSLSDVRFETARVDADLSSALDAFLEVEASGWKGRGGTSSAIRLHPEYISFYRRLATDLGGGDGCEINMLHADGRCVAGELCMRTGEEYAVLKIGYDEEYARLSPGHLLCERTLQRCCADPRITRFNQLSDADWLRAWHADSAVMRQVHVGLGRWTTQPLAALLRFRFGPARRVAGRVRRGR